MKIDISNISFTDNGVHKKYDQSFVTRYVIVTEIVKMIKKELGKDKLRILDLGGYNGVSRQLLPDDSITILDVFEDSTLKDYIRVSEVGIPTEDDAFDVVISTDTLEHIPNGERVKFIDDAVRVAKHATVIAAPFEHEGVGLEELLANNVYIGETGQEYNWLKEHREFQLPERQWIEKLLKERKYSFARFSHSSLRLWGELISTGFFIANNIEAAAPKIARRLKLLNAEYFRTISSVDFPEDGYRSVYVISKKAQKISIKVPSYDVRIIEDFTAKCRRMLGVTIAEMSHVLYASTQSFQDATKDIERLKDIERNYLRVTSSRSHRLIVRLNRMMGR